MARLVSYKRGRPPLPSLIRPPPLQWKVRARCNPDLLTYSIWRAACAPPPVSFRPRAIVAAAARASARRPPHAPASPDPPTRSRAFAPSCTRLPPPASQVHRRPRRCWPQELPTCAPRPLSPPSRARASPRRTALLPPTTLLSFTRSPPRLRAR
ncbi:hypothetical protein B0H15DRAFT_866955 [Mycena belliarum]|uniref:Uncharacterized protein n=1 Tax=Mycena belliarum TaxID=1033014 RepID=A0AAD6XJF9_9AGAR|nr:hypothetical protein B0H15DRAFT_866955 [Mycena belliae]